MQAIELFLSSARGVYIPRDFAEMIDRDRLKCDNGAIHELDETLDFLIECDPYGEDSDLYWQEWCCLVDNCYIEYEGNIWRLWHDGDLWLYCEDLMTEEEKQNFFFKSYKGRKTMKVYSVTYRKKCSYTDLPIGDVLREDITAKNVDHLLYLCHYNGWLVMSYQRIA